MKNQKLVAWSKTKMSLLLCTVFLNINRLVVYADKKTASTGDTKLITGTVNLFNDLTADLLVLSPIIGGALGSYFFIRKNAADESDQKQWNKRLITTLICTAGAFLVSGVINKVTGYYK